MPVLKINKPYVVLLPHKKYNIKVIIQNVER